MEMIGINWMTPAPFENKIMYVNATPLVRAWLVRHRLPHLGSRWLLASENSRPAGYVLQSLQVATWIPTPASCPRCIHLAQSDITVIAGDVQLLLILCSDSAGCNLTSTCVYVYICDYMCVIMFLCCVLGGGWIRSLKETYRTGHRSIGIHGLNLRSSQKVCSSCSWLYRMSNKL